MHQNLKNLSSRALAKISDSRCCSCMLVPHVMATLFFAVLGFILGGNGHASSPNADSSRSGSRGFGFTPTPDLPNLLVFSNGTAITTGSQWRARRTELKSLVQEHILGGPLHSSLAVVLSAIVSNTERVYKRVRDSRRLRCVRVVVVGLPNVQHASLQDIYTACISLQDCG